ncbi:porin [Cesiribacter sp. SM1]|uniref:porin n=1 Tax=Cesiribacter sp. SM1 TaxID=2861196 RepID=UPI001CD33F7C|nr:porin [Cesiribacter sp. SM1]
MNKIYRLSVLLVLLAMAWSPVKAYKDSTDVAPIGPVDHSYKPLVLRLNEEGSKYLRLIMWHQFWVRSSENNPGTVNVAGEPVTNSFDIGLRRSRMLAMAQISPRFLILTHFGINNHSFVNGGANGTGNKKPGLFIHDAWTEYAVINEKLYVGAGLHYWNGISRLTNSSTLNMLTLDAPIFNWPNIELTDQFARQYGIYAKGKLGKLDYRLALNKPFTTGGAPVEGRATNRLNDELALQGYLNYQFLEQESNQLPYMVGTYLGTKEIFNIGLGFHHHPKSTALMQDGEVQIHDMLLLGADVFYERPVGRYALSAYSSLYSYDFGPNYIRNIGIMNVGQTPEEGSATWEELGFNGAGTAQPTVGTGTISYTQLGVLLPKLKNQAQLMPYVTYTRKNFEFFQKGSSQYDLGLNYFINGHNAKITAQYSTRPLYSKSLQHLGNAGELTIQTHIFL